MHLLLERQGINLFQGDAVPWIRRRFPKETAVDPPPFHRKAALAATARVMVPCGESPAKEYAVSVRRQSRQRLRSQFAFGLFQFFPPSAETLQGFIIVFGGFGMKTLTLESYAAAGVDVTAGYEAVERIKPMVESTYIPGVMGTLGGFGGMFAPIWPA